MKILPFLFLICIGHCFSQNIQESIEVNTFFGYTIPHDTKLIDAIDGLPYGTILSYNFNTTTYSKWRANYNYPDFGASLLYQNTSSSVLGEMYALLMHYNFYLTNRNHNTNWLLGVGMGPSYHTKKYDAYANPRNLALGTTFGVGGFVKFSWNRTLLDNRMALQAGVVLTHFSSGGLKSPNLGLNTLGVNLGINYKLDDIQDYPLDEVPNKIDSKLGYNFEFKTGLQSSKNLGSRQYMFYTFGFMVDKILNQKSTLVSGTELFITPFLEDYIDEENVVESSNNTNNTRVGVYIGHELNINKFIVLTHLGYNVYYPKPYVSRLYERFGFKYRFNKHIYSSISLKVNLFRAEMTEIGIGYRF